MTRRRVTDDEVEKALHWLVENAKAIGKAKEKAVLAEKMVGHIEAVEMKKAGGAVAAQKRDARASLAYRQALFEEAQAAGEYEVLKSLREAAAAKIDAWRTESATHRSMKL